MKGFVLLLISVAGFALAEDRGLGVWHFDPSQSTYESGPAPRQSQREWIAEGEWVRFRHRGVGADGKPFQTEFRAKYDGTASPVSGSGRYDAVSLKLIDPQTVQQTFTLGGKITVEATRTVSRDGRSMTILARGTNPDGKRFRNVLVYRRKQ